MLMVVVGGRFRCGGQWTISLLVVPLVVLGGRLWFIMVVGGSVVDTVIFYILTDLECEGLNLLLLLHTSATTHLQPPLRSSFNSKHITHLLSPLIFITLLTHHPS